MSRFTFPREMRSWLQVVLLLFAAAPMLAQEAEIPGPPSALSNKTLQDALQESIRTKKYLLVYPHYDKPGWREMDDTTWKNPTLATWIMWKGIAIKVDPVEDPKSFAFLTAAMSRGHVRAKFTVFPHVFIFCDGKLARIYPDPDFQGYLTENNVLFGGLPDATVFYPKASQILFTLDFLGEKLASTNPVWLEMHNHLNPMPEAPPPPPPLCQSDDGTAPPVADPAPGPEGVVDVLAMLERARDLVKGGELYEATGIYTWLWERADKFDPSFRAARMSFVASEIGDLARKRDGSMRRFNAVRQPMSDRQPWWTWEDLLEWIILSRALSRDSEVVEYFSQYTVDEQEQTMMPSTHRSAYNALMNLDEVADPRDASKSAIARVNARNLKLQIARPAAGTPAKEWAEVVALRRRLLIDEGSRLHAALLLRGDVTGAFDAARLVLGTRDEPGTRLTLVTTALVAGSPLRPEHQKWLSEAQAAGANVAVQQRRVQNALSTSR